LPAKCGKKSAALLNLSNLQGCGSGFSDFVDTDPDPGARKLRNFSGKMHFLIFLNLQLKGIK
jgi:hypothetical protein